MSDALPTAATAGPAKRFTLKKAALSVLAIGLATSVTFLGSQASWTAQTQNAGNSVTAGTMSLTNDKNAQALFAATNAKPGDTGTSAVVLKNAGTIPMSVALTQDQAVNALAAGSMQLQIHDATRNWCYYPVSAAGACSAYGDWSDATKLTALALPNSSGGAQWAANETHTFNVNWRLNSSSPNSDQGKAASFRLTWDGIQ